MRAFLGIVVAILAWELVGGVTALLPSPVSVFTMLVQLALNGSLVQDAKISLLRVIVGVGASILLSLIGAALAALHRPTPEYFQGIIELIRPIPPIALTPLAMIAFGIGDRPAIAIVAFGSFFPIWLGLLQGLREIRPAHIAAARSLGANRWRLFIDILVPSITPYAFHGVRIGVGLGWFCVVAAEMMGTSSGLGYGIQLYSLNLEMEKLYAYVICIGILGYLSNFVLVTVDRRLYYWREEELAND